MEPRHAEIEGELPVGKCGNARSGPALAVSDPIPNRAWWRLEGVTKIDCGLFTERAVIFIEGERTELGASRKIEWYPHRNQVLRNLDCAAEYAAKQSLPYFFCLFIVEGKLCDAGSDRRAQIDAIVSTEVIEGSLPHLSTPPLHAIMSHYCGFTTWEQVTQKFNLSEALLPDTCLD